jgi:hypothetical protein
VPLPDEPTLATAFARGRGIVGRYMSSQRSQGNPGSFFGIFDQHTVRMNEDGTIELDTVQYPNGQIVRWHEVAPLVWREVGGRHRLGARVLDDHAVALYCDYFAPSSVLQPVPVWRSANWNIPLLLATLLVLIVAVLAWPASALLRRVTATASTGTGPSSHDCAMNWIACALNLGFLGGTIVLIVIASSPAHFSLTYALDPWLRLLQIAGALGVLGTGICLRQAYGAWASGNSWRSRGWKSLVAAACLAAAWFAIAFNLLSWRVDF